MIREALKGLTVVDITQIGAGPTCSMLLGDMGARVFKVEPVGGEIGRSLGPAWVGEDAALFHVFNRSKQGIALDIKSPQGREIICALIERADIVIESMRPGAMARAGLGYDTLGPQFPRLIYCSISAYGQQGPYAHRAGVDGILQADSGLMSLIGLPSREPCKVQAPVVDVMTGYVACVGVLALLAERERTGRGGHVDASLLNSALALQQPSIGSFFADGKLPVPMGSAAPYSAPNQAFQTADGWIMVAAYSPERWAALCLVLNRPDLARDERFITSHLRVQHLEPLVEALTETFRTRTSGEWLPLLQKVDILCARVATYESLGEHPQILANRMLAELDVGQSRSLKVPGFPLNSSAANALPFSPAPALGEHTAAVLGELGYSEETIARLAAEGAIVCATAPPRRRLQ